MREIFIRAVFSAKNTDKKVIFKSRDTPDEKERIVYTIAISKLLRGATMLTSLTTLLSRYYSSFSTTVFSTLVQSAFEETFRIRLSFSFFSLDFEPFHFHAVFSRNQGHVNHSWTTATARLNIIIAFVVLFLLFVFLFLLFSSSLLFFFLNVSVALINTTFNCLSTHLTSP